MKITLCVEENKIECKESGSVDVTLKQYTKFLNLTSENREKNDKKTKTKQKNKTKKSHLLRETKTKI